VWVLCQVALTFLFSAIILFISQGTLLVAPWGSVLGVAFLAAFCSILIRLEVDLKTVIGSKFEIHVTERLIGVFVSHSADVLFVLKQSSDGP